MALARIGGLALTLSATVAAQVSPRPSQLVDLNTTFSAAQPCISTDGDRTVVGFVDNDPFTPRNAICIVTSDGRGKSWSAPRRVDQGPDGLARATQHDSVAVLGDDVFVLWRDDRSPALNRWDLYLNKSVDGGASFLGERRLDTVYTPGSGSVRDWRFVVVDPANLYVFFAVENPSGQNESYLTASHDGGSTWTVPLRVDAMPTQPDRDVQCVAIAVDPALPHVVHMAWTDNRNSLLDPDAFYRRTIDGGLTLDGPEIQLDSSGPGFGIARDFIEIDVVRGTPYVGVAWLESGLVDSEDQMQFALSGDGGASFATDITIAGGTLGEDDVDWIAMAAYGPMFHAAWTDDSSGTNLVRVARAPLGSNWSSGLAVSRADGAFPSLVGDSLGTLVGVFFDSGTGPFDRAEAAFSTDFGATWHRRIRFGDQPTNDVDFVRPALNEHYRNFVAAWVADTGSAGGPSNNRVWVGGFRPQTCTPIGWDDVHDPANTSLGFELTGFGTDSIGIVGLSLGGGPVISSGDGRAWEMGPAIAPFGGVGFAAPLTAGDGTTLALPNVFLGGAPLGLTVRFGAVSFGAGPGIGHLTDVLTFDL